jgi:predicted nucleotidyltransferase
MLNSFRKFVGFKILEYFLKYPTEKTYLNELAKKLQISSRSVKIYCDIFDKQKIIKREIKGNMHIFTTNNDNFRVREMKRSYFMNIFAEMDIENIAEKIASIAIYGSYASGNYDEKSDVDILIIGEEQYVKRDKIVKIMETIGKEFQLNVIPIIKWEKLKKDNNHFVKNIIRNHVLIRGAEL